MITPRHVPVSQAGNQERPRGDDAAGADVFGLGEAGRDLGGDAPLRVLLAHDGSEEGYDPAEALADQGLIVTVAQVEAEPAWAGIEIDAAVVRTDEVPAAVLTAVEHLKQGHPHVPALLWAPLAPERIRDVLNTGFDAWLPAEAGAAAVHAQLQALCLLARGLRRPLADLITVRTLTVDFQRHEASIGGQVLGLTPTELRIIAALARQPGRVVPHRELFRAVHGHDAPEQEAKDILKVHISRLRTKFVAAGGEEGLIATVRGFGYLLERRAPSGRPVRDAED